MEAKGSAPAGQSATNARTPAKAPAVLPTSAFAPLVQISTQGKRQVISWYHYDHHSDSGTPLTWS